MQYQGQIPFHYADREKKVGRRLCSYEKDSPDFWEDNHKFEADLTFKEFRRGRSAAHAIYLDDDQEEWVVFLTHLREIIETGTLVNMVHGIWTYAKRGQNYGIRLIRRLDEDGEDGVS